MKIFVTGGSGFIGSAFIDLARQHGHEIVVFDQKPSLHGTFVYGDITDRDHVIRAMAGCDAVVHLAAMLGVKNTENNYLATLDVNIQGTKNVLEACIKNGIKKVVFSSSSEVYGNAEKIPISEDDKLNPVSVYGFSKVACEFYVKAYHQAHGLDYAIVRYFNVYGTNQRDDFVIPRMVSRSIAEQPVEVYGDGAQIRAFTHVSDAARGTLMALENGHNEVFNIGNDLEPISMKELAMKITRLADSRSVIQHVEMQNTDRSEAREIFKRVPSIIKAKKLLGYEPQKGLNTGLLEIINNRRNLNENL